jgi:hypothetical protein
MATVSAKGRPKEKYCEHVAGPLWARVGLVFESGNAPKNAQGMIRHPASSGKENKWEKFYFPKTGANVNLLEGGVSYEVPASMKGAHHGELLLTIQGKPGEAREQIVFARLGEKDETGEKDKAFTFKEGASFLPLWIWREEEASFKALYILHKREGGGDKHFVLMVRWKNDRIALQVFPRAIEQVPHQLLEQQ